jgi:archaellum component FlaF (FlaF/FlaG flagellin family)
MVRTNYKKRRGLSSVIGAIFMVLIMIGALNLVLLAMRQQDTVTQAVIDKSNSSLNKLNERIEISSARLTSNNRLNMTITNNGGSAAQLVSMYIVNETASPKEQFRFDLNNVVDGRSSVKNIGTNLAFTVKDQTNYSVRLVTKEGNTATMYIGALSQTPLQMIMFIIPPTLAPGGGNATILMSITNNYTDTVFPRGINASMSYSGACNPTSLYPCTVQFKAGEGNGTVIARGSTAFYKWIYNINSPDGTVYTFTGKIVGGVPTNTATATLTMKLLDANRSSSSGTTDVLSLKFLGNVGLSIMSPGNFGTSSTVKGVWGIIVSNPTGGDFTVSRVTLTLTNPTSGSDKAIASAGCSLTQIQPSSGWTCPVDNVLQWAGSPITVPAYQSRAFLIGSVTGSTASGDIPAWLISANAYTSYGQYAKTGYTTNTLKNGGPMPNVYFSSTSTDNNPQTSHVIGALNSVPSNTVIRLNVSLTDWETGTSMKINNGAKVVINLPPQWAVQAVDIHNGFSTPVTTQFSDNSYQISATRTSDINGCISSCGGTALPSGTISFLVRTPTVESKWIYILSATTDGTVTGSGGATTNLATVAEMAVQVNPP